MVDGPSNSSIPITIVTALTVVMAVVFVAFVVCRKFCRRDKLIGDGDSETDSAAKVRSKGTGRQRRRVT